VGLKIPKVVVQLSPAAQLEQEQSQAPPQHERAIVDDQGRKAGVRQLGQPSRELRPEMADGADQRLTEFYERPCRLRRS
jgi:hypothetical protein